MDPVQMEQMVVHMERMNQGMERLTRTMEQAFTKAERSGGKLVDGVASSWEDWEKNIPKQHQKAMKEAVNVSLTEWERFITVVNKGADKIGATLGQAMQGNIKGALSNLVNMLPGGAATAGVIGFLMLGLTDGKHWDAVAQQTAQNIEGLEDASDELIGAVRANMKEFQTEMGAYAPQLGATIKAAAEAGFGSTEQLASSLDGTRRSAMVASAAMDALFEVGAGTSAQAAAQLAAQTNQSFAEGVDVVRQLGGAARATGINFQQMLGSVMQATSALRLQMDTAEDLQAVQRTLGGMQAGLMAGGASQQRAGQIAMSGMQGIVGALAGLPTGLKAVLGEQMTGKQGLAGYREFEQGVTGEGKDFFMPAMRSIMEMTMQQAQGDTDQQYFILRQLFGMSSEAATALQALQRDPEGKTLTPDQQKKYQEELKGAFKSEGDKLSAIERLMKVLLQVVKDFATASLHILLALYETLSVGLRGMNAFLSAPVEDKADALFATQVAFNNIRDQRDDLIARSFKDMGSNISKIAPNLMGTFDIPEHDALDAYEAGQRLKHGGPMSLPGTSLSEGLNRFMTEPLMKQLGDIIGSSIAMHLHKRYQSAE